MAHHHPPPTSSPSCPQHGCEMCIGTGSYDSYSCNACRRYANGERWHCPLHNTDLCFTCNPVGGASRKTSNNVNKEDPQHYVDPHLQCLQDLNDRTSDFALLQQQEARKKGLSSAASGASGASGRVAGMAGMAGRRSVWTGHGGVIPVERLSMLDTTYRLTEPER